MVIQPLETNRQYLTSVQDPMQPAQPQTGGGASEFGQGPLTATAETAAAPLTSSEQPSSASLLPPGGGGALFDPGYKDLAQGLFKPLSGSVENQRQEVRNLGQTFATQAGPSRTYEGIGAESTLMGAIAPGATATQKDPARALVGATYAGPQDLDQAGMAKVKGEIGGLQGRAEALRTGSGIESYLGQAIPGLTPGQAKFEASKLRYDPNFMQQGLQELQNVGGLGGALEAEDKAAREIAAKRTAEETAIREKSRGFLGTQQTELARGLEAEVAARSAEAQAIEDQYRKVSGSGAFEDVPEEFRAGFDTPGRQQGLAAEASYREIMDRYAQQFPEVAGYEPLEKIMTKRGKEWYGVRTKETNKETGQETEKVVDIRKIQGLPKSVEHSLVARQRELEKLFGADLGREKDKEQTPYRDVAPLSFGSLVSDAPKFEDRIYKPQDVGSFFSFDPAAGISVGNLATDDQIATYNNISDILDQANVLGREEKPFQAARIAADVDRFLAEEEVALKERGEKLNAAEIAWRKKLRKMRTRYVKLKGQEAWGAVDIGLLKATPMVGPGAKRAGASGAQSVIG